MKENKCIFVEFVDLTSDDRRREIVSVLCLRSQDSLFFTKKQSKELEEMAQLCEAL